MSKQFLGVAFGALLIATTPAMAEDVFITDLEIGDISTTPGEGESVFVQDGSSGFQEVVFLNSDGDVVSRLISTTPNVVTETPTAPPTPEPDPPTPEPEPEVIPPADEVAVIYGETAVHLSTPFRGSPGGRDVFNAINNIRNVVVGGKTLTIKGELAAERARQAALSEAKQAARARRAVLAARIEELRPKVEKLVEEILRQFYREGGLLSEVGLPGLQDRLEEATNEIDLLGRERFDLSEVSGEEAQGSEEFIGVEIIGAVDERLKNEGLAPQQGIEVAQIIRSESGFIRAGSSALGQKIDQAGLKAARARRKELIDKVAGLQAEAERLANAAASIPVGNIFTRQRAEDAFEVANAPLRKAEAELTELNAELAEDDAARSKQEKQERLEFLISQRGALERDILKSDDKVADLVLNRPNDRPINLDDFTAINEATLQTSLFESELSEVNEEIESLGGDGGTDDIVDIGEEGADTDEEFGVGFDRTGSESEPEIEDPGPILREIRESEARFGITDSRADDIDFKPFDPGEPEDLEGEPGSHRLKKGEGFVTSSNITSSGDTISSQFQLAKAQVLMPWAVSLDASYSGLDDNRTNADRDADIWSLTGTGAVQINRKTVLGASLSYKTGDVTSTASASKLDGDYYGATLFASHQLTEVWNITGFAGYTHGDNDIDLDGATGSFNSETLSAGLQLQGRYFLADDIRINPDVTMAVSNTKNDGFLTSVGIDSIGTDITSYSASAGGTVSKTFAIEGGAIIPSLGLHALYEESSGGDLQVVNGGTVSSNLGLGVTVSPAISVILDNGATMGLNANLTQYKKDVSSWTLGLSLKIPFN